jgi:hypothetical protein
MTVRAHVVHRTRSRIRLRVPDKRGDHGWFSRLRSRLLSLPGVESIHINPLLGSVLMVGAEGAIGALEDTLAEEAVLALTGEPLPQTSALSGLASLLNSIDRTVEDLSAGSTDLRTLAFVALFGLALRQALRGEIVGPALPLIWYAFTLLENSKAGAGAKSGPRARA